MIWIIIYTIFITYKWDFELGKILDKPIKRILYFPFINYLFWHLEGARPAKVPVNPNIEKSRITLQPVHIESRMNDN